MENHSYHQVLGSTSAPYETQLANGCATMSRYHSVGTPSLPNYLGATSGSTWGISDDADPGTHPLAVDNLFRQVRASGGAERSYEEDMPTACVLTSSGEYEVKHNPAAYYNGAGDRSACKVDDLPLGSPDSGPLARELSAGGLPTFAFITPNLCNDTHDCGVSAGDAWLARWVPRILGSPDYRAGGTALFVVWDEDSPMPNIVVSPSTHPGTVSAASFDHYSLLRTAEEMLGLPLIGAASGANSMRSAFNL